MKKEIERLSEIRSEVLQMGPPAKVEAQRERGKMTVRERVDYLFDKDSFQEYGIFASHDGHKPGDTITPADGVVAGFGRVDGRMAAVLAEDFTVMGGSTGGTNFKKRVRMIEIAAQERVPLILLLDGAGARAQGLADRAEGLPAVYHFLKMAKMSGIAPQVAVVMGGCAGEPALEASLAEFIIMVKGTGMLAAGGPPVVFSSLGHRVSKEDLGGVDIHCRISGGADNPAEDDEDALCMTKRYLSYFPNNAYEYPPSIDPDDDADRKDDELLEILPENPKRPYDMYRIIHAIVDRESLFEIKPLFATMMITGLARMNGHTIGIVANQPMVHAGAITAKAAQKQRHFIDLCSAYHIPLLFLVDTPGVMTGARSEKEASMRFGLAVAHSMAWADVPIFTVIIRKAFGFGGAAMSGYGAGQTLVLGWPTVDFASLPVDSAIEAAHAAEIAASNDPVGLRRELKERYEAFAGPYLAAAIFNIDDVIDPRDTRPRLVRALELALNRRSADPGPVMRHGVMP